MKKIELLAPAGSFRKAKIAFMYGADAVYCGTPSLSLRARSEMYDNDLYKTIEYAHNIDKKVYAAINIFAWDDRYGEVAEQAKILEKLKVDGIIVADGGVLETVKQNAPSVDIHMSTQSNIVSSHSAEFWHKNGAQRMILARELNKENIKEIAKGEYETEIFIHGAICFGYSGRCFLSDFLAGRSANLGDCAQSCRWEYNVYVEERNNPGNLIPIEGDNGGTHIFSSKDLCLIKEIPEIMEMGISSLKIEGRLKTEYYLATVINAYRSAIDDYTKDSKNYDYTKYLNEIEKVKTRSLTTFYFNDLKNKDIQEYEGKQYNPNYEFAGIIMESIDNSSNNLSETNKSHVWADDPVCSFEGNIFTIEIKNRLQIGDTLEMVIPNQIEPITFTIDKLWDAETDKEIEFVNPGTAEKKVKMILPKEAKVDYILRRKK